MYMDAYDDLWFDMLMSNGKMLYLQKHETDFFTARGWPVVESFMDGVIASIRKKTAISLPSIKVEAPVVASPSVIKTPSPQLTISTANVVPKSPTLGFKIPPLKKG
jgi:hypothetical protein